MRKKRQTIGQLFLKSCFRIVTWVTFGVTFTLSSLLLILFYYGRGLPDHTVLENYQPILSNRIYYGEDQVWRDYAKERRFFTPIDLIPDKLTNAFLAAEDKHFFSHPGLDLVSVFRAFAKNTLAGKWHSRPMGASTITQQVAKNMLLSNERSFGRKIKEAITALRIEKFLSKRNILELYLNQIYLGSGCYGVTAAAEHYFHKTLDELSMEDIAFLAGLPKAPEAYQPSKSPSTAKARRDWVLSRLYEEGMISGKDILKARQTPIIIASKYKQHDFEGDYFLEAARQKLIELVGQQSYAKGGYFLWTTVDPAVQKIAHRTLQEGLERYTERYGYDGPLTHLGEDDITAEKRQELFLNYARTLHDLPKHLSLGLVKDVQNDGINVIITTPSSLSLKEGALFLKDMMWAHKEGSPPPTTCHDIMKEGDVIVLRLSKDDTYTLTQLPKITGGIVVMNKETGHVLALTGGYHFSYNQFNNATQAMRQPGSAFKPFVYLAALERGYSKDSRILDAPISIPLGFRDKQGRTAYSPKNYSRRYYGMTTLEDGLAYSRNVMTVRLAMQMGMRPIQQVVKRFGLHEHLPRQLAMTLGAGETTLLKLTAAYAMLANGGYRIEPTFFHRIEDRHGAPLYSHNRFTHLDPQYRDRIASASAIQDLQSMMVQVVQKGTARSTILPIAEKYGATIFGKTGTTNDYKDAWFVGSTGSIVVGVFIGFPTPKSLGDGQTGGKVAAPIAARFFDEYLAHIKRTEGEEIATISFASDQEELDDASSDQDMMNKDMSDIIDDILTTSTGKNQDV